MKLFSNIKLALAEVKRYERSERSFIYLCCFIWANVVLQYFYATILHIGPISFLSTWIGPCVATLLIIGAIPYFLKKVTSTVYILFFCSLILYLLNYQIYPENTAGLNRYSSMFYAALPMIFIGVCIEIRKVEKLFYYISVINIISCSFYFLIYAQASSYDGSAITGETDYNMGASYTILPHVIYVTWQMYKKQMILNIFATTIGFILIASFGTRGPLVCYIIFNSLYLLIIKQYKKPARMRLLILCLSCIVVVSLNQIMLFLAEFVNSIGMSDRIFQIALEGNFIGGESSGNERLLFADIMYNRIQNSTDFLGHGIAGTERVLHTYPHNLFLEILHSFGLIPGITIMGMIVYIIIKKYFSCHNENDRSFLMLLLCCGFIKLFMSGTFLVEAFFFFLIGYSINTSFYDRPFIRFKNDSNSNL